QGAYALARNDVDEPWGSDDDRAHRPVAESASYGVTRQRALAQLVLADADGDVELVAQLARNLDDARDGVLDQQRRVDRRPPRPDDRRHVAQQLPELLRSE